MNWYWSYLRLIKNVFFVVIFTKCSVKVYWNIVLLTTLKCKIRGCMMNNKWPKKKKKCGKEEEKMISVWDELESSCVTI